MNDLVKSVNGEVVVSSKQIADYFGKIHRDVMKVIKTLNCSDEFRVRNFSQSSYTSSQNKVLNCFNMTKDGFTMVAMGFGGEKAMEFKEAYINAFNQMEKGLLNIDTRMNKLTIEGENIKQAGKEWGSFGREVNRQKKGHTKKVNDLLNEVQCKLDFSK